jgi:phytoene synthase
MREASHRAKAGYAYCELVVRRDDPDRWLASLFVPREARSSFHALLAFSLDIARVREIVSEPLLGEIRFQWWRDALEGAGHGDVLANPVAVALIDTIERYGLPVAPLLALIDARQFDLYDEPMERLEALETYANATCSSLFSQAALILEPENSAGMLGCADHAGIAYALTGILRALPWHSARGQVLVPLEILARHGADRSDLTAGRASEGVLAALAELRAVVRSHMEIFHLRLPGLQEISRASFLAASLCEPYLLQMEKPGYDPFNTIIALPQWRRQWILWRASKKWGKA